jgi:integrase
MKREHQVEGYVRARGDQLEAVIKVGRRKMPRALGLRVGQEEEARAIVEQAIAELRASSPAPVTSSAPAAAPGTLTVRSWGEAWIADRKARVKREWVNERVHLASFLYPVVGDVALGTVNDVAMLDWARGLEKMRGESGNPPSPKYIRKITATVRALFKEAVRRHHIERTPCIWEDTDLPELEARAGAMTDGFTLEQVAQLVYDERIPEDRRVLYALEFLTGMRTGEAAARAWVDWEPDYSSDLGRLLARTAYNTRHHVVKETKTRVEKWIPVHPELARVLEAWKRDGWERFFGRAPRPEDFIVPARTPRDDGTFGPRNNGYSWRTFQHDLETLGLGAQRHYESRSTFINLAEGAKAPPEVVARITHPSVRSAKDLYSRARLRWPAMCAAVRAIALVPPTKSGSHDSAESGIALSSAGGADVGSSSSEIEGMAKTGVGGRARESNPPAAPFSTTHRF